MEFGCSGRKATISVDHFKKPDGDTATDKNNALIDNAKVKQLRVSLDGTFYPQDRLEINWEKFIMLKHTSLTKRCVKAMVIKNQFWIWLHVKDYIQST